MINEPSLSPNQATTVHHNKITYFKDFDYNGDQQRVIQKDASSVSFNLVFAFKQQ